MNGELVELTGFTQAPAWLPWAVQYFFLIGLSVGAFFITLPAYLFGKSSEDAARAALLAALTTGLAAPVALLADLHQPDRFWHFYAFSRPTSWMALGAFFLPAYVLLLGLYGWVALRPELARQGQVPGLAGRIAAMLAGSGSPLPALRRTLGILAAAAAALVALYTGAEVAVVAARPLWHSPMLPLVYLASGIAGGAGLAMLFTRENRHVLARWLISALALTAATVLTWAAVGGPSGEALVRLATEYRPTAFAAWLLFGVGLPLALALRQRTRLAAGVLAVFGAWLWRWEIFMAGQAIPKNGTGFYGVDLPLGSDGALGITGTFGLWILIALALTAVLRPSATHQA